MKEEIMIDFVVLWVDSNNPEWQARYKQYRPDFHPEDAARFRNWGLFPYWFRAVEAYAPWVNKVYLVTSGEVPDWLNLNHPKLVHVKHEDFIPAKYLPTFSTRTIELNLHRIASLSEHFVFFNDDMFLNGPVEPTYFFRKGLPCDAPCEASPNAPYFHRKDRWGNNIVDYCNIGILNTHFNRALAIRKSPYRWLGFYLGLRTIVSSIKKAREQSFQRFKVEHFAQPFLKSTYEDAWQKEYEWLDKSSSYKFRQDVSLNQWFLRYWQLASNRFYPKKHKDREAITFSNGTSIDVVKRMLLNECIKSICLNDTPYCGEEKYNQLRPQLIALFESKFPKKSDFEK
jgi:hypothetical protein